MKKIRRKRKTGKIILILIAIICLLGTSYVLYADEVEKTTIQCEDINMFNALKSALSSYILLPTDVNKTDLTIKIPTSNISSITELKLNNCQIENIAGIEYLTALKKIQLSNNNITDVSKLATLDNLESIYLNSNPELNNIPADTFSESSRSKIYQLILSDTGIKNINFAYNMPMLFNLQIARCSIDSLAPIEGSNVNTLNVSGNQSLKNIKSIATLSNLWSLDISDTGITSLETNNGNIYDLHGLRTLEMSGLNISSTNPVYKTYKEYVEEDGVTQEITHAYLENLIELDISYIPENLDFKGNIQYLENLKILNVTAKGLVSLDGIYKLSNLEKIYASDNEIEDIKGLVSYKQEGDEIVPDNMLYLLKTLDLSHNQIEDISVFNDMTLNLMGQLNLSYNKIQNADPIENLPGTVNLERQNIILDIYDKVSDTPQYIFLPQIMQKSCDEGSKLYEEDTSFLPVNCTLNLGSEEAGHLYNEPGKYNVIITGEKTLEQSDICVFLMGGIAKGSVVVYNMTNNPEAIDSLVFADSNLNQAIYNDLKDSSSLYGAENILNLKHSEIESITSLDLSNRDIVNLDGLQSFTNLAVVDISNNHGIENITPLKWCTNITSLNASNTSLADNISEIKHLKNLKELILNNIGLTKIDSINELTSILNQEGKESALENIDLSSNQLESVEGIQNLKNLKSLTISNNKKITEVPDLSNLTKLDRITMYGNSLTEVPKVGGQVRYMLLGNNKINDLSNIDAEILVNLVDLDLSNNQIYDETMTPLIDLSVQRSFKIAGNKISDISSLTKIIKRVSYLDISDNYIDDVDIIDSYFSKTGVVLAKNQRIFRNVSDNVDGYIDFPNIFISTSLSSSPFYIVPSWVEKIEPPGLNLCEIIEYKIKINDIENFGNNAVTYKVKSGPAEGTSVTISNPIVAKITYDTPGFQTVTSETGDEVIAMYTKGPVTATISFPGRDNNQVIITNPEDGSFTHTFTENGTFTFEFRDRDNEEVIGSAIADVSWIDNELPIITINKDESQKITSITISDNIGLDRYKLWKDGSNTSDILQGTTVEMSAAEFEPGEYTLEVWDVADNYAKVEDFVISEPVETLTSDLYTIDHENKIIKGIRRDTEIGTFSSHIFASSEYTVKNKEGNAVENGAKVGTGYTVETTLGTYKLVVENDLTGDGELQTNDLGQAQKIFLNMMSESELDDINLRIMAIDRDNNGIVDLNELARLQKVFLGLM